MFVFKKKGCISHHLAFLVWLFTHKSSSLITQI